LSAIQYATSETIATATLVIETHGPGLTEFTTDAARFLADARAGNGALFAYLRHTSASLVIQENADPDVQTDLVTALDRLAPEDAGWIHHAEGPDDMPAHVKAALTQTSLAVPVSAGRLALGTWQGIYLFEHRSAAHTRSIVVHVVGV
jgi:secondary thiamine-phosphate synthase enzyme